ncbi:galactose mutarotase-like [Phymastichus coffea]|uniref:galactose mutarotase-like n=1 Tax=Phymastichus coffea TaxID=108790 RepID=UPI00273C5B19|nr:galactose mutarotase-like [Phymastichus coffea]
MDRENCCQCKDVRIVEEVFGQILSRNERVLEVANGKPSDDDDATFPAEVKSYRMSNNHGTEVVVINWAATIVSIKCLDKYGQPADIALGFDDLDSKTYSNNGTARGRWLEARLTRDRRCAGYLDPKLSDALGGTVDSCDDLGRRLWESRVEDGRRVVMSCLSAAGEDGRPGALLASVKFELTGRNSLEVAMRAVASRPRPVNLTHYCVLNLAGHAAGSEELRAHEVALNCDRWLSRAGACELPTLRPVGGSALDLRVPRPLGRLIDELADEAAHPHYLTLSRCGTATGPQPSMRFAARLLHRNSGRSVALTIGKPCATRFLEVYSDQPGLDLSVGGELSDCLPGKCGASYRRFGGFGLLPRNQLAGAAPFPSATLRPGQVYYNDLLYRFGVDLDDCCLP